MVENIKTYKQKGNYVCLNGEFIKKNEITLLSNNRAFRYGDGVFETIRVIRKEPLFFSKHIKRLTNALSLLKIDFQKDTLEVKLKQDIVRLLNTNKFFAGAKIRITVYRESEGLYTPENNNMAYLIESSEVNDELYTLNTKGLNISIFHDIDLYYNQFSSFKSINSFPYILAGIYSKNNNFDDCILTDNASNLIEGISSNLFLLKNNSLFTPSTQSGCINGIMRNIIIDIALSKSMTVFDEAILTENDLLNADEVFLTNVVSGVKWVLSYKKKRYYKRFSKLLIDELNKLIF